MKYEAVIHSNVLRLLFLLMFHGSTMWEITKGSKIKFKQANIGFRETSLIFPERSKIQVIILKTTIHASTKLRLQLKVSTLDILSP